MLNANDSSTIVFARTTGISRCLRNAYTLKHAELEEKGATFEELREFERSSPTLGGWKRVPGALMIGNIEEGSMPMGAIDRMIHDLPSAAEIIHRFVEEYDTTAKRL